MSKNISLIAAAIVLGSAAPVLATAAPAAPAAKAAAPAAQAPTRAAIIKNIDTSFKAVDSNGDGILTQAELAAAEAKGVQARLATARQRMDAEFAKLDTNKDGQLSKAEFMAAAPQAPAGAPNGADAMAQLDKNGDGKVVLDEYRAPLLTRFDAVDTDRDGTITAAERQAAQAKGSKR